MNIPIGQTTTGKLVLVVLAYHLLAFLVIQSLGLYLYGHPFNSDSLLKWDARHYQWIAEYGYVSFRQAFFPLLPLIWRIFSFGSFGISVFNAFLYLTSLIALTKLLNVPLRTMLIWMTLPSAIFFFAPYSESIFFAGSTIIIVALRSRSRIWVAIGLFTCVLSRPAFTTLLPSLLLVSFISNSDRKAFVTESMIYVLTSAVGLILVSLIQYHFTGDRLGFITAQQIWGNKLRLPELPLSSWGGQAVSRLDAVAFLVGMLSLAYLCRILWVKFKTGSFIVDPEVLLSCGCIASISLLTLFFRGGELFSLNRFVFATPFALVLIDHAITLKRMLHFKHYVGIFFLLLLYFLLFGAYVHIQTFLKFAALSTYLIVTSFFLSDGIRKRKWLLGAWLILAFAIQVYFALSFLGSGWVG